MAINAKMLQYRGAYANFRPSLLLPGQFAVVLSGDPNTSTGKAVYMCFSAGTATRILADGDVVSGEVSDENIAQAVEDYLTKNPLPSGGGFVAQAEPPEDTSVLWVDTDDETSGEAEIPEVDLSNYYTKTETYSKIEIDAIMGSYINDIDALVGGDA